MQISHNGVVFIEDAEGFKDKAYKDGGGVWTIGFGTTYIYGKPVQEGMVCTRSEAELWMTSDLATTQTAINRLVKVPLKQTMYDALVSLTYNIGVEAFRNSTLLKLLLAKDYAGAGAQFDRWNKDNGKVVAGLVSRRHRERVMFEG